MKTEEQVNDFINKILQTSGLWKFRDDISDSVEYVNGLRDEMNNHPVEKKRDSLL